MPPDTSLLETAKNRWATIVGRATALHSEPVDVVNGVLKIAVHTPAWSHQLAFLEREICDALPGVERLRFVGGRR